jgi:hypothetical protein
MKKLALLVAMAACVIFALPAFAVDTKNTDKKINCCVKGDCREMTKADCKKEKGKVVKSCKDCKPAAPKAQKSKPKTIE